MRRLKKWIDEIRAENKEYAAANWMCRYSGDTAEFIVHPHVVYNSGRFKHTVIRIGMILTRLSKKMEETGYVFHVQTFPSLEDLKIVASIRLNVNLSQGNNNSSHLKKPSAAEEKKAPSAAELLNRRARHHRLDVTPIGNEKKLPELDSSSHNNSKWYLIGSSNDNPFTWLHVGFFAQEIFLSSGFSDPGESPLIISGPELNEIREELEIDEPPTFFHACIAIIAALPEPNGNR
ncbi:hypothetical protein [Rhodohalobacter mucosus]|uniref:Uncharacterized protein n=1 Tax=Rhodohalobacter mucosus TaxID=2079485 RepID=A0A316TYT2_9BACT|nr:hypothetical protein [Rhodohalobacter mucosus]PWN05076.1 hypothetical protein DDZ15_16085 [Rhodohalobacter mucosus]